MGETLDRVEMINMFTYPVFEVKSGVIQSVNQSALNLQIQKDTPVSDILTAGKKDYASFTGGTMSLGIKICNAEHIAAVVRSGDSDIFHVLSISENAQLQSLALASQHLRDPLCNVMALTDILFSSQLERTPKQEVYISQLNQNLHRLLRTVGNMSDTGAIASRTSGMEVQNIYRVVTDALYATRDLMQDPNRLKIHENGDQLLSFSDKSMLERAVYNLISNAVKYSPAESTVEAWVHCNKEKMVLTVENICQNFNTEQLGTIFFRYRRIPSITDGASGLGLGIPMIQAVAIAHKGSLLLTMPEANKLRFCLSIPLQSGQPGTLRNAALYPDYYGGNDLCLTELADILPSEAYE